jgi:hypothetical protein
MNVGLGARRAVSLAVDLLFEFAPAHVADEGARRLAALETPL